VGLGGGPGGGGAPPLILILDKKEEITNGRKAGRASPPLPPLPHLAQGLDPPLSTFYRLVLK